MELNKIFQGDCVEVLQAFPDNSIDLVVTDPPYGLSFMGKDWDKALPSREAFEGVIRVLKPGALAFVMSSPRQDVLWRMLSMLEGVGFELTQSYIDWIYKTGFPKAYDVSKGIDKRNRKPRKHIEFQKWLESKIKDTYGNHYKLAEIMNLSEAMIRHWIGKCGDQDEIPTREQYEILKEKLMLDDQYDYLIEWSEAERKVLIERTMIQGGGHSYELRVGDRREVEANITIPTLNNAKKWDGWKSQTGLKPAHEPILMVNKPFSESTIVDNVLKWGTGAINVDACRIPFQNEDDKEGARWGKQTWDSIDYNFKPKHLKRETENIISSTKGRFPANLLVSDKAIDTGKKTGAGVTGSGVVTQKNRGEWLPHNVYGDRKVIHENIPYMDVGDQSRYFDLDAWAEHHGLDFDYSIDYDKQLSNLWHKFIENHNGDIDDGYLFDCLKETLKILRPDLYDLSCLIYDVPKPSKAERDFGLQGFPLKNQRKQDGSWGSHEIFEVEGSGRKTGTVNRNYHPTVKPIKLMAYLIELGCPPDGVVLDPFMGSGTTCIAAKQLVRKYIGIEINPEYFEIAKKRIAAYPNPLSWFE